MPTDDSAKGVALLMRNSGAEMNIRHDLDPVAVRKTIGAKIAEYMLRSIRDTVRQQEILDQYNRDAKDPKALRMWVRKPDGPEWVKPMYRKWIAEQRDYYSKVRVIELPKAGKRFILVYGDENDAIVSKGTGPFETLEEAKAWFLNQGR